METEPLSDVKVSGCLDTKCVTCNKKSIYRVMDIDENTPASEYLFLSDSPLLTVMCRASTPPQSDSYLFFRCDDRDCLLKYLKDTVLKQWVVHQNAKAEANMKKKSKKNKSRKANRKARSK